MDKGTIVRAAGPLGLGLVLTAGALAVGEGLSPALLAPQSNDVRAALNARDPSRHFSDQPHEFYFTRAIYTSAGNYWGRGRWAVDWPKADRQFLFGLKRLIGIDAPDNDNPVRLTDPELSKYPFLYALEVGYMRLSEQEVEGLRRYLKAGGFLFIDDFWGTWEWRNFEREIARVLPGSTIVDLPLDHPVFHTFYDIEKVIQVPNIGITRGGPTWEQDGYVPYVRGIFDDDGRLLVLINWNTDLGDAWEWVDNPYYPIQYSNFAYQLAVNTILYAMSH